MIEYWKAGFLEFDSFFWFRVRIDLILERFFKSLIRFLGSGQGLFDYWKAHFQVFDSFSLLRVRMGRILESSFLRVRFVFFVRGKD